MGKIGSVFGKALENEKNFITRKRTSLAESFDRAEEKKKIIAGIEKADFRRKVANDYKNSKRDKFAGTKKKLGGGVRNFFK